MKKYLVLFLAVMLNCCLVINNSNADDTQTKNKQMSAKVESRRIPKGTRLKIKMLDYVSSESSPEGSMFSSILIEDKSVDNSMILPSGSLVRGYVRKVKPRKMLSRGAVLYLQFDHIVIPSGTQLPIRSAISSNYNLSLDGGLYVQSGYGDALKENWQNTKNIAATATNWGLEKDAPWKYFLTPVGAIGGFFGGGGYYVGDSVADIFRKGKPISINKNDILEILILQDLDVPVL